MDSVLWPRFLRRLHGDGGVMRFDGLDGAYASYYRDAGRWRVLVEELADRGYRLSDVTFVPEEEMLEVDRQRVQRNRHWVAREDLREPDGYDEDSEHSNHWEEHWEEEYPGGAMGSWG